MNTSVPRRCGASPEVKTDTSENFVPCFFRHVATSVCFTPVRYHANQARMKSKVACKIRAALCIKVALFDRVFHASLETSKMWAAAWSGAIWLGVVLVAAGPGGEKKHV